jgi:hypothetical protein
MNIKSFIYTLCFGTIAIFGSGCASYKLGSTLDPALADVFVPTVRSRVNQTDIEAVVTSALISEIQREGTMCISKKENATTILEVEVIDYKQNTLRYHRDDLDRAAEYSMTIVAKITFKKLNEVGEEAIIASGTYEGYDTFLSGTDTITAKQNCLPNASKKLAELIVEDCVNAW